MAYGQTNVNAGARGGEFLVGNLNFFQIATVVPCYPTNVKTPLAQALKARNWTSLSASRTITVVDGNAAEVTFDTDAEYTSAYNKQKNLDTLLGVFATRANPVVVSVSATEVDNDPATDILVGAANSAQFGSTYTADPIWVYNINLATERNPAWVVDTSTAESNTNGYQLLAAMNGTPVLNTTATTPAGPQDATAAAVTVAGGTFVVSGSSNDRNILAKVRNEL